jgi:hypothetical protein
MARRRERLFDIHREMTPLQPGHEKGGQTRDAPLRLTVARMDVRTAGHFRWIGLREQPLERLEMLRIARVNHRVAVQVQSHARSMSP